MIKLPVKMLFSGETHVSTGYGVASTNFIDRFYQMGRDQGMPRYDVSVQSWALNQGRFDPPPTDRPYRIFPAGNNNPQVAFGQDTLAHLVQKIRPQICISFGDLWMIEHVNSPQVIPPDLRKIFKAIALVPIDGEPIPPIWLTKLRQFDHVIFYSKFAKNQADQRDEYFKLHSSMVYHGVNSYLFRPLQRPYVEKFKEQHGLKDKFVIGMVARNQARRSHPRLLVAFQKFAENKNDVVLLLHCMPKDQGWDLNDLVNRFNLNGKVFFTNQSNNPAIGMPDQHMVTLLNTMDVHVLLGEGEGFGIPILESMSCGVPNLVNHYGAEKELVEDSGAGFTIKPAAMYFRGSDHNYQRALVDTNDVVDKLQWMYEHPKERQAMGRKGRAYALNMSWDKMAHQFDQVITKVLDDQIQYPIEAEVC